MNALTCMGTLLQNWGWFLGHSKSYFMNLQHSVTQHASFVCGPLDYNSGMVDALHKEDLY